MDIFTYIENKSKDIAKKIGKGKDEEDIEVYEYSIFLILSQLLTNGTGIIISLLLGIFLPYVVCVVTYMILRSFAGGYHCKTFKQCYFTSNILYLLLVALGLTFSYNSWLLLGIALIPSVGIIPLCPKPSEYSLSRGKVRDKRFRIKYIVALAILTAIAVGLIALGYPVYANMIACGMIGTVIMVTDCCSSVISQIWKLIDGE